MGLYDDYYEARQHLNLSQIAYDTIDQDRYLFLEKPSFARMLNLVFETYRDYADATIEMACERYSNQLKLELERVPDNTSKKEIITTLVQSYKSRLIQMAISYPRECQLKFQLNKENYSFLIDWRDNSGAYSGIPGKYIKAVIEEYSRKPYIEREKIIFRNTAELINASITQHLLVIVTLNNNMRYEVRPHSICVDQGNNYHYFVGYSKRAGANEEEHPASFRITNIKSYKTSAARSGRLTEAQKHEIDEKIRSVGVQFLLQSPEIIQVKLTHRGKVMYESQAHLRPAFINRKENNGSTWIYDFNCTKLQAQFYFFKFGADVEIISPADLREVFWKQYGNAYSIYNDKSDAKMN